MIDQSGAAGTGSGGGASAASTSASSIAVTQAVSPRFTTVTAGIRSSASPLRDGTGPIRSRAVQPAPPSSRDRSIGSTSAASSTGTRAATPRPARPAPPRTNSTPSSAATSLRSSGASMNAVERAGDRLHRQRLARHRLSAGCRPSAGSARRTAGGASASSNPAIAQHREHLRRARAGRRRSWGGSCTPRRRRARHRSWGRSCRSRCCSRSAATRFGGVLTSSSAIRPPGRTTRPSSVKKSPRSSRLRSAKPQVTPSTDASGTGSRRMSVWTRGTPDRSAASMPKLRSIENGRRPAAARSMHRSPVPLARSSTLDPPAVRGRGSPACASARRGGTR